MMGYAHSDCDLLPLFLVFALDYRLNPRLLLVLLSNFIRYLNTNLEFVHGMG